MAETPQSSSLTLQSSSLTLQSSSLTLQSSSAPTPIKLDEWDVDIFNSIYGTGDDKTNSETLMDMTYTLWLIDYVHTEKRKREIRKEIWKRLQMYLAKGWVRREWKNRQEHYSLTPAGIELLKLNAKSSPRL